MGSLLLPMFRVGNKEGDFISYLPILSRRRSGRYQNLLQMLFQAFGILGGRLEQLAGLIFAQPVDLLRLAVG